MSTLGLLDGVKTGWGMMNQHNQQEENKRRYDERVATDTARYGAEQEQIKHRQAQDDATFGINTGNASLQQQALTHEVNNLKTNQDNKNALFNQQLSTSKTNEKAHNSRIAVNTKGIESANKKEANEKRLKGLTAVLATQDPKQISEYINTKEMDGTDVALLRDKYGRQAAKDLKLAVEDGYTTGNYDNVIPMVNKLYKKNLNRSVGGKGRNGGKITDVEALDMERDEKGNMRMKVRVTTDKGEPYESYVSELRSADPNDKVKQFTPDQLFQKVNSLDALANMYGETGVHDKESMSAQRYLGGLANGKSSRSGSGSTNDIKNMEWVGRNLNIEPQQLAAMYASKEWGGGMSQNEVTSQTIKLLENDTSFLSATDPAVKKRLYNEAMNIVLQQNQSDDSGSERQQALLAEMIAAQKAQRIGNGE